MPDLPQTRQSLLVRLSQKSGDAWAEFLEIYEQAIYQFCRRRGLQDADAWDVTQDVLAAVDKKIESWDADTSRGKFRGWLFRVARNIAVDKVIEQTRRAVGSGDSQVGKVLAETPGTREEETTIFWMEYRRTLMGRAVEQIRMEFKETSWQSFLLTTVEGRQADEVAQELGISVGSVYAAKFRIVSRIRKQVARFDDGDQIEEQLLRDLKLDS
ncbi:MAG: RNA polymerase sigma factor [Planctomycetaceae bacterium]